MNRYLFTPGPVPVSRAVAIAEAGELVGHRGRDFSELFLRIEAKLMRLLDVTSRVVILPSSGTGALECLAQNLTGKRTEVLSVSCGVFGDRFRHIVSATDALVYCLDIEPGDGAAPELVADALKLHPNCNALLLTQNETSTGVQNPIKEITDALPRENRPLVLVDGVSSVGAMPCYPEKWGIDGLATASQKGLLTPPGLGLVWLSERAWKVAEKRAYQSYFFSLPLQKKYLDGDAPENPYTPPVSLYYALDAALDTVTADGWHDARARAARALAAGLEALGCDLLVKNPRYRSPGVTAFSPPGGDTASVLRRLRTMGIDPAGGQESLKGRIIRMAHYHDFNWPEISLVLGSLYAALGDARREIPAANFMEKALEAWEEK